MNEATRILIVEDSKADLELAKREIRKHLKDCVFEHVETRSDFLKVLDSFEPHLIISDYNMPGFDGMKALRLAQDKAPLTPFIVWTGSLGEDIAAECMKAGANNYIIKENLKRLGPAVIHALEERQLYLERKLAEEKFQSIFENSADGIFQSAPEGHYLSVNPAMARIYGYDSPRDMLESITDIARQIYVDAGERREFIRLLDKSDSVTNFEARNYRKDGSIIWVSTSARVVRDASGRILYYEGFSRDITERRRAEIELQQRNDDLRLINVINESVIRGESLDTIVDMLAKELKRIFSSEGSTIYMIEPDGQSLTMQKYFLSREITRKIEGLIGSTIPLIHIPVREGGFFHQVISSQRGRITSDPSEVQAWIAEFTETTFLPPAARAVVRKLIPQLYNLLNIKSTIIVPLISDGKTIGLLDVSSSKLFTDDDLQRIEAISGQLTAAIQRQKAIERVRRSEEFLKSVQNALTASIAILDEEGTIVQVNSAWRKFADRNGYTHPDYGVGVNYLEVCDSATGPDAREAPLAAKAIRDVIMGQRREAMLEYPCNSPDEKRWFTLRITRFEDEERMWVVLMHENITERKQAEEAFKESSEQFRTLFEASPEAIMLINPEGNWNILDCNTAACRMNGYTREELLGQSIDILNLAPASPAERLEYLKKIREAGTLRYEDQHRRKDGTLFPIEVSTSLITLSGREVILGIDRDITERKHAEAALRENEKRYRALFEDVPVAIWEEDFSETKKHLDELKQQGVTDLRAYFGEHPETMVRFMGMIKILDVNNAALTMYEASNKEELIRSTVEALSKGEQKNNIDDLIAIAEGRTSHGWEGADETLKGTPLEISLNWSVVPGREADYSRVIVTTVDITGRKQAEEALRQSENRYRTVVESQSEFIVRWKPNGKRTFVNEAYCRYFGVDPEQALNSNFMPLIHEDDRPAVEEKISRLFAGAINAETDIHRVIRPDGSIGWQEWTDHAIRDKDGKLIEFQSVGRDITERKQAEDAEREQRALAEALRETAEILNSTLDYGEVLDHILAAVGRVVPHDAATIMLIEKGVAHVARMRGYAERGGDSEIMKIELSMTDTVNLQQMLKTGHPVVVSDTRSYPGWKNIPGTEWIRSNVGVPISVSGEVAGFILLNSETPGFFNPIHAERLEAFANQAALAIRNARLLQQAQEEITERKQAEKELRASEERFRQLANNIKEVFWITDAVTNTDLYLSPAYESIWGRPPEMQYQNPQVFIDSILPEDRPAVLKMLEIQRAGKSTDMEYRIMRPDGTIRWIWDRAFPIFDDSGRVISLTGIAADITERKEVETALRERDALLLESQRVAKLGHYRLDIRSGQWESSETLNDIFGIDKDYATDINGWAEIIHPDQRDEMLAYFTGDVLEKQNAFNREYRIIRKSDGQERWVHGLGQLEFDNEGKPTRMIGTIQDITERKLAEEALRESEERFGNAFEFAPIGIALVSLEGRWMKVNRAICELLGYTEEELLSTTFQNVTYPDDLDTDINYVKQMLAGKINTYQMEKRYIHKSGHLVWVLLSVSLVKDRLGNPKYFISQIQDITERRQAEEQLRKLSRAVEQSASTIVITDTSGNIEYVNPKFTETTGYTAEEALGQNPRILKSNYTPPENYSRLWKTIKSGREWHGEFINKKKNGEMYWESATISPIFNERGETTHFIAVKEDITERKQAEAETKRHLLELEALYENGLAIGRLLEPQEIGERIIETFSRYLSWHHATIRLRKGDTDELDLIAFNLPHENGEDPSDVKRHFTSHVGRVGEGISGWVVQTGQPVRTGNLHDHPHYVQTYQDMQSGLYMPLRAGDRVIGVISVESEQRDAFSEQDERLLATLATQAAIAFENARLYHSIQQERERFLDLFENSPIATWLEDFTGVIAWMDELKAKGVTDLNEYFKSNPEEYKTGVSRIRILDVNHAAVVMNGARDKQELISIVHQLMADDVPSQVMIHELEMIWEGYTSFGFEMSSRKMDGSLISGIQRVYIPVNNNQPDYARVIVTSTDITERKRSDTIMQKRLELMEFASHHSLQELMQRTLDEICELTHSRISFLQLLGEDEKTPGLHLWSTEAASLFNIPEGQRTRHSVDQAGVWADAVRQRRSVIQNDYASLPDRKGLPEGHAELIREVMIPIIRNDKVMAVVGIGNKPTPYTREDVEIAERFADHAWDIMERKQMEAALAEERNLLAKHVEERTADLSRANSNLARALRVKDEFLANMSHELRTPLNAILGLSESLAEQVAGTLNEKQLKYVTTISESGHHLLSLINDILDLAKIEAGQITLDINKVDVNSVCQASLRMIKQMAQKKNLEVSLEIDGGVGLMWADERRLKQMMVNLLSNAVKFTPEGGKIGLKVMGEFEENKVLITVWDTGIGIKENDFQHLFKPFVQLDSGLARESTGTGLGLALVAQMARLHGGSVSVTSDPGKGSQFTITLPWEPALAADTVERMKTTGKFRAIRPDMHQETILLIEDTEDIVMMIKDYLEQAGYKVASAQDGIEGIEQAKLVHPDLILMDIQMPRMDGFETTQRLRQDPEFKYTPIIALTALAMPNDRERCLAAGMDEYISKPVNLRALVKIIQNCLSFREQKTRPR